MEELTHNDLPDFNPIPFKISTITATGGISSNIDLKTLYEQVSLIDFHTSTSSSDNEGFIYIEYGQKKSESIHRGYHKKMDINKRKKTECKRFDNQATVILKMQYNDLPHYINMKVFKNGNIQMTGLKFIDQGRYAIDYLIKCINNLREKGIQVVDNDEELIQKEYKIRLINSDFRIGFEVKRDKLCKLIQTNHNVFCSFEPCIYPGVKIQFNWNVQNPAMDGTCKCSCVCNGKGNGQGDGFCKKITIAVFQSGCIIITGAQTYDQINDAYNFICNILKNNLNEVYKKPFTPLPSEVKEPKKKVLLKKSKIRSITF